MERVYRMKHSVFEGGRSKVAGAISTREWNIEPGAAVVAQS
jgi:hypothetical protein